MYLSPLLRNQSRLVLLQAITEKAFTVFSNKIYVGYIRAVASLARVGVTRCRDYR